MKTKETLKQLQKRLELIDAWGAVSISFGKKKFPKTVTDQVRKTLERYIEQRILEIDQGAEEAPFLTAEDIKLLRLLADKVKGREAKDDAKAKDPAEALNQGRRRTKVKKSQQGGGLISQIIQENQSLNPKPQAQKIDRAKTSGIGKKASHNGNVVEVMTQVGEFAIVREDIDSEKYKVPIAELHQIDRSA